MLVPMPRRRDTIDCTCSSTGDSMFADLFREARAAQGLTVAEPQATSRPQ